MMLRKLGRRFGSNKYILYCFVLNNKYGEIFTSLIRLK